MKSTFVMAIALIAIIVFTLSGIDVIRKREQERTLEIIFCEAQAEERISKAREMRIIVDLKLKAIDQDGMRGYLKTCEILERKK